MADWHDYIKHIDFNDVWEDEDRHGRRYISFGVELTDDMLFEAMDQMREYMPTDDSYMDVYLLRYEDGSTDLELCVNEDFSSYGRSASTIMDLDDEVHGALDEIEID